MNISITTKRIIFLGGLVTMAALFSRCSANTAGSGTGTTALTTNEKITSGLGSATTTMQSMGGALGGGSSSFSTGAHVLSTATSCSSHSEPGDDTNLDGSVGDSERYNQSDSKFALTKVYCTLAHSGSGPESVSGAVRLIKTVACAVEKQLGSLAFDGTVHAVSSITIDTKCATAEMLQDMNNGTPTTSLVMAIPSTIVATKSVAADISEFSTNTYYSHGLKIASNDGTSLKFIVLAKFDDTIEGDPIENGDFEFATYGTGTQMQGTAIEYTAGKIDRSSSTSGTLWYEARHNRIKHPDVNDPICQPGTPSSSCGFARHVRIKTDITFSGGDISDVANMSVIMSEGYDTTGSGQSTDFTNIITATGSLTSGLTGKSWSTSSPTTSPRDLTNGEDLSNPIWGTPVTSCITGGGSIGTSCGGAPAALAPTGPVATFVAPANTAAWLQTISANGGIGFTTAANLDDAQHP